jgi:hypothetical protein
MSLEGRGLVEEDFHSEEGKSRPRNPAALSLQEEQVPKRSDRPSASRRRAIRTVRPPFSLKTKSNPNGPTEQDHEI